MSGISKLKRNYDNEGNLISKECSCCHKVKPVSEFTKNKSKIDGLKLKCRECVKEYNKEYCKNHKEYHKEYYKNNAERIKEYAKEYNKEYKKNNAESIKKYHKEYYKGEAKHYKEYYKKYYQRNAQESLQQIKIEVESNPDKYNYITDKEIFGIIYLVHNINSDKYYVGQTTRGFDNRYPKGWLAKHVYKNTVREDLELYGEDSFEYTKIFKVAHSQYELDKLEAYYIDYYNSYENGYNENRGNIFTDRGKEK